MQQERKVFAQAVTRGAVSQQAHAAGTRPKSASQVHGVLQSFLEHMLHQHTHASCAWMPCPATFRKRE